MLLLPSQWMNSGADMCFASNRLVNNSLSLVDATRMAAQALSLSGEKQRFALSCESYFCYLVFRRV
eukprot:m.108143 g.108143  ORF g.108143 m.108143 type:complete len:66 (-) comp15206_c3_seq2:1707-1904(-)